MFTGIVEEIGTITAVDLSSPRDSLVVHARSVLDDMRPGDSIAINGVCLTVTSLKNDGFSVGVMSETLRRTNLGRLAVGKRVNLERPIQPHSRLGGHFVQGHVDGTGTVTSVTPDGTALAVRIEAECSLLRYVVEKGFVAIDGASLTVTSVEDTGFSVALVPYSQDHLSIGLQTVGSKVNLEVDILAKYLEKLVVH
jgi:riboflavin synthase